MIRYCSVDKRAPPDPLLVKRLCKIVDKCATVNHAREPRKNKEERRYFAGYSRRPVAQCDVTIRALKQQKKTQRIRARIHTLYGVVRCACVSGRLAVAKVVKNQIYINAFFTSSKTEIVQK